MPGKSFSPSHWVKRTGNDTTSQIRAGRQNMAPPDRRLPGRRVVDRMGCRSYEPAVRLCGDVIPMRSNRGTEDFVITGRHHGKTEAAIRGAIAMARVRGPVLIVMPIGGPRRNIALRCRKLGAVVRIIKRGVEVSWPTTRSIRGNSDCNVIERIGHYNNRFDGDSICQRRVLERSRLLPADRRAWAWQQSTSSWKSWITCSLRVVARMC